MVIHQSGFFIFGLLSQLSYLTDAQFFLTSGGFCLRLLGFLVYLSHRALNTNLRYTNWVTDSREVEVPDLRSICNIINNT